MVIYNMSYPNNFIPKGYNNGEIYKIAKKTV